MAYNAAGQHVTEARRDMREDVHFRTRVVTPSGAGVELLVVNVSARGLMARCEDDRLMPGEAVWVRLPGVGSVAAEVRWALGGRVGIEFEDMIELARYMDMLADVLKR